MEYKLKEFEHRLPKAVLTENRQKWLTERCNGKRVLHIGCVDSGILEWRLETNDLLQSHLIEVAEIVVGIDIDREGISYLRDKGYKNLEVLNIAEDYLKVVECGKRIGGFEIILIPEVLEHVLDMGHFLDGIRKVATEFSSEIVLTVPNAYSIRGIVELLRRRELVHPDHNCYFSPITIRTTLKKMDIDIKNYCFIQIFVHQSRTLKKL